MSYVHPYSKRCDKGEVDLFTIPPTQQSLEKGRWVDYQPLSTVQNDDSAITFMISGTDEYIDLSKTILYVEGKIQNGDESDLSGGSQASIAPVNNFLHSLFKQVDVYFNGKQVTPAMGTYAYRSYIETLLNYDVTAKQSQFSSALYYKDTAGHFEESGSLPAEKTIAFVKSNYGGGNSAPTSAEKEQVKITVPGTGNQGFAKRHEFIKGSREFVLTGPIFSDVFMSDRLLLNMLELKVVLNRSPNTFCLMDKNSTLKNPKVKLTNVVLKVRKVKVDQAISQANEIVLKKTPAFYPIRRVECKVLSIPGGLSTVRKDNIFSGLVPNSFVFGLVDLGAFNGQYKSNPYNFQHFGVKNISLTANGEEIPFKQLTLTYPKDGTNSMNVDYIQAYNTLFSGTGKMYANTGLDISRDEYAQGNTLYAFDLTPDMCHSTEYFNVVQRGSLSVALTFDNSENPNVAMVCYGDFENVIRIDAERNVIYDIS